MVGPSAQQAVERLAEPGRSPGIGHRPVAFPLVPTVDDSLIIAASDALAVEDDRELRGGGQKTVRLVRRNGDLLFSGNREQKAPD